MTNTTFFENAEPMISEINELIEQAKKTTYGIIGDNLLLIDLCLCGLLDRSIRLSLGFIQMVRARNLTCSGALVRLLIDNCLRLFAIYISDDEQKIAECIIKGKRISNLKDKNGKKLTDTYLKKQLGKYDEHIESVYDRASGFIHFSSKAVFQSIIECEEKGIKFQVGGDLSEDKNEPLLDCLFAYQYFYKFFLNLMNTATDAKVCFDKDLENQHV